MTHRFIRAIARRPGAAALCAAIALAGAAGAAPFDRRAEQGSRLRYEIFTRFAPTMHDPVRGDYQTVVESTIETTLFVTYTDGRRRVVRMQIDGFEMEFLDSSGGAIVGYRFDDDDPVDSDARNPAGSLRSFVGKTFDIVGNADGEIVDLREVVWPQLPEDDAGNLMRRLIGEGMLTKSIQWIFSLPPEGELEVGESFSDDILVRFPGDGHVNFAPMFTLAGVEGDDARFVISGDAVYTDDRPPVAVVTGRAASTIDEADIGGEAVWLLDAGVLDSLELTALARLEPEKIDPLGRRIDRRSIEERFRIRRLDEAAR